eukprot:12645036-Prorocentrum_lima.AAC.1
MFADDLYHQRSPAANCPLRFAHLVVRVPNPTVAQDLVRAPRSDPFTPATVWPPREVGRCARLKLSGQPLASTR